MRSASPPFPSNADAAGAGACTGAGTGSCTSAGGGSGDGSVLPVQAGTTTGVGAKVGGNGTNAGDNGATAVAVSLRSQL
eukprot:CAMPEP_0180556648 /NCGR_PEP_ID=MMETSP1037_2-20121125/709_1 /TAXON_ID=632150 /ORGANISM="Azadinium spinosum, Strain 3D9" /LENGTH=78 /DNA_ID=CAMNT_0022572735 /DNA_START=320 /DNA_END=556 /DNA_ORIENTATION=-